MNGLLKMERPGFELASNSHTFPSVPMPRSNPISPITPSTCSSMARESLRAAVSSACRYISCCSGFSVSSGSVLINPPLLTCVVGLPGPATFAAIAVTTQFPPSSLLVWTRKSTGRPPSVTRKMPCWTSSRFHCFLEKTWLIKFSRLLNFNNRLPVSRYLQ